MAIAFLTGLFPANVHDSVPENVAHTIFKDVIVDILAGFSLEAFKNTIIEDRNKRKPKSKCANGSTTLPPEPPIAPDKVNSRNIALLLLDCLILSLDSELDELISSLCNEVEETCRAYPKLFEYIYIPVLKQLNNLIQETDNKASHVRFRYPFQKILNMYIIWYLHREPPIVWTFPPLKCCFGNCTGINAFLQAPNQKVREIPLLYKDAVATVENELEKIGCTYVTDRETHRIIITKPNGKCSAAGEAWKLRHEIAKNHLESFGEPLKDLLGEHYDSIMSLRVEKLQQVAAPPKQPKPRPLARSKNTLNRVLPPITKRKVPTKITVLD